MADGSWQCSFSTEALLDGLTVLSLPSRKVRVLSLFVPAPGVAMAITFS